MTIVGVVGMVKQYGLDSGSKIVAYFPHQQATDGWMYLVVRTSSNPADLANAVVREIHAVDSGVPVFDIRTMQDRLYDSLARQRFATTMLGAFAAFALVLAARRARRRGARPRAPRRRAAQRRAPGGSSLAPAVIRSGSAGRPG